MTLAELLTDLYDRLNVGTSPAASVTTRLTRFINQAQRDVLAEPGLERLLIGTATFASVASTPQYALPPSVARIHKVYDTTNQYALLGLSLDDYRTFDPATTSNTGTPTHYVNMGSGAVAKQPSDASALFIDSTAAGDTGTLRIEGYRTGGYFLSASVVMTGTTAVNVSTATADWIEITKLYISAAAVGTVTLCEDAEGGTVLATIPIGQTQTRYKKVALWPCPASAITYSVDYERDVFDMAQTVDEPVIPHRFHQMLIDGVLMREMTKKDDAARYTIAVREYQRKLSQLKYFLNAGDDVRPVMGRRVLQRPSQLGGTFPSGS